MRISYKTFVFLISIIFMSCTTETESYIVKTPPLELKGDGPFFQGSNTLSATWKYSLKELIPELDGKKNVKNVRVNTIKIVPKSNQKYPEIGQVIMQLKSKNKNLSRIGLIGSNFKNGQSNSLKVSQIQDGLHKAIEDENITFLLNFEMLDDKFDDDIYFELIVTFNIRIPK